MTADSEFYYRVDSIRGLRSMGRETMFKAQRWDGILHASLRSASASKEAGQEIFRICFWNSEQDGRSAMGQFLHDVPAAALLRVRRAVVRNALKGWNFEGDDCLPPGAADLIWKVQPAPRYRSCSADGIPLEAFEVWNSNGIWQSWAVSELLLPARVRLSRMGWQPITVTGPNDRSFICHWHISFVPGHQDARPWCFVALEEGGHQTLREDVGSVEQIAHDLLEGPIAGVGVFLAGFAVINITPHPAIAVDQYRLAPPQQRGLWDTIIGFCRSGRSRKSHHLERCRILTHQQLRSMLRTSGLSHMIAMKSTIWQLPQV